MAKRIEITQDNIEVLRIVKGQDRKKPLTSRDIARILGKPAAGFIKSCEKKNFLDRAPSETTAINYKISPLGRKAISAWDLLF